MSKLRVSAFTVSADGFGAGPDQGRDQPLGRGGEDLHQWFVPTRTFQRNVQSERAGHQHRRRLRNPELSGTRRLDPGSQHVRADAGAWPDSSGAAGGVPIRRTTCRSSSSRTTPGRRWRWKARPSSTSSPRVSMRRWTRCGWPPRGQDVRLGGGVATIRQYLQARLIEEMHLAISPILLGQGEPLFDGIDLPALGYRVKKRVSTEAALHLVVEQGRD